MESNRFRSLDAARGLAAVLVLIHHLDVYFPVAWEHILGDTVGLRALKFLSSLNSEAVMLFFVISGYCIRATSVKYDFRLRRDIFHYATRRGARILPLYIAAIGFTFFIGLIMHETGDKSFSITTLVGNLLFLQIPEGTRGNWFVPFGHNAPLWSLSFEVFYYAIFPVMILAEAYCLRRLGFRASIVGLFSAFCLSLAAIVLNQLVPNPIFLFTALYCVWRIGVSVHDVQNRVAKHYDLVGALVALAAGLGILMAVRRSATLELIMGGVVVGLVWTMPLGRYVPWLRDNLAIDSVLAVFALIGTASYALYLLHYPIVRLSVFVFRDTPASLILAVASSLVAAFILEWAADSLKVRLLSRHLDRLPDPDRQGKAAKKEYTV